MSLYSINEDHLAMKLNGIEHTVHILFKDLSKKQQAKFLKDNTLEGVIKRAKINYRREYLLVVESLGEFGADEIAREESLTNLF